MCLVKQSAYVKKSLDMKPFYRSISSSSDEYCSMDSGLSTAGSDLDECCRESTMEPGQALKQTLRTALSQGRVTCGIYEAAQLLEMAPAEVMCCIVPADAAADVTLHIHLTLIEAFCWENDIRLIKADSSLHLKDIVCESEGKRRTDDYSCLLVEYPQGETELTEAEEELCLFHKSTCDMVPQPVINLSTDNP